MVVALGSTVGSETTSRDAYEPPKIVSEGLEGYKNFGHQAAFETWLKGSPIEGDSGTKTALVDIATHAEQAYGRMGGYEFIRTAPISPLIKRVYVALLFEKSPLYVTFDCYRTGARLDHFADGSRSQDSD